MWFIALCISHVEHVDSLSYEDLLSVDSLQCKCPDYRQCRHNEGVEFMAAEMSFPKVAFYLETKFIIDKRYCGLPLRTGYTSFFLSRKYLLYTQVEVIVNVS